MFWVYLIYNTVNGSLYVGETGSRKRWSQHRYYGRHKIGTQTIHLAMHKHGCDNFIYKIVEDGLATKTEALAREEKWIAVLTELGYRLYNQTKGGRSALPAPTEKETPNHEIPTTDR